MELPGGEFSMSCLDDIYLVTSEARAVNAFETVAHEIEQGTSIKTHMVKLQMWCESRGAAQRKLKR